MGSYRYGERKGPEKVNKFFAPKPQKGTKPLVGWRSWSIEWPDVMLYSASAQMVWESPTQTTKKMQNGKLARVCSWNPVRTRGALRVSNDPYHDYGIYSYKSVELLNGLHRLQIGQAVGLIGSSGHVVEHEYGYRAQICIVEELWMLVAQISGGLQVQAANAAMGSHEGRVVYADYKIAADKLEARYHCPVSVIRLSDFLNLYQDE